MDASGRPESLEAELAELLKQVPPELHDVVARLQSAVAGGGQPYSEDLLKLASQLIRQASPHVADSADVSNVVEEEAARPVVFHQPGWTPENVYNAKNLIQVLLAEPATPRPERLEQLLTLSLTRDGQVPPVRDIDPYEVGVSPSAYAMPTSPGGAPYVSRQADERLCHLLAFEPVVLVVGDAAAGKSRSAFEAAASVMPDAAFLAPVRKSGILQRLCSLDLTNAIGAREVLVWLDDLEGYLGPEGFDIPLLDEFRRRKPRWVVLATIRASRLNQRLEDPGPLGYTTRSVLNRARTGQVYLQSDLSPEEWRRAAATYPNEDFKDAGIGEVMIAAATLRDRYLRRYESDGDVGQGPDRHMPDGQSIVQAAVDWRRAGVVRAIRESELRSVYEAYLTARYPDRDPSPEAFEAGVVWARRPIASRISLLKLVARAPHREFEAFDYLTALDDGQSTDSPREIYDAMWSLVLESEDSYTLFSVATQAYLHSRRDIAKSAYQRIAAIDVANAGLADCNLGVVLAEEGDLDGARNAYERVIASGHLSQTPRAQTNLGILLEAEGDVPAARSAFQSAMESAHPEEAPRAALHLAVMLCAVGDFDGALSASERAEEAWNPLWVTNARIVKSIIAARRSLAKAGKIMELDESLRKKPADDEMKRLLELMARANEASEQAWDSSLVAIRASLATASGSQLQGDQLSDLIDLGNIRGESGDLEGARTSFQSVIDSQDPDWAPVANMQLGTLLFSNNRLDEAFFYYQRAVESNHPYAAPAAAFSMGLLLEQRGDVQEALEVYRAVADLANPEVSPAALFHLGELLRQTGDLVNATEALQKAVDGGDPDVTPDAAFALGFVLQEQGDSDGARTAYQKVIAIEDAEARPVAAFNLGMILSAAGDSAAARKMWQIAADSGDPDLAEEAATLLADKPEKDTDN